MADRVLWGLAGFRVSHAGTTPGTVRTAIHVLLSRALHLDAVRFMQRFLIRLRQTGWARQGFRHCIRVDFVPWTVCEELCIRSLRQSGHDERHDRSLGS